MTGWRGMAVGVSTLAALVSAACGSTTAAERTCRQESGAEVCLVEADAAYRLEGTGLRARSELLVAVDEGRAMVFTADEAGGVPGESAASGVLRGPTVQHMTVTGRSAAGVDVRFEFEIPAVSR